MELKFVNATDLTEAQKSFNRTFMELKSLIGVAKIDKVVCFNRTFMELKLEQA